MGKRHPSTTFKAARAAWLSDASFAAVAIRFVGAALMFAAALALTDRMARRGRVDSD